jgi:Glycosyl hydrolase family 26
MRRLRSSAECWASHDQMNLTTPWIFRLLLVAVIGLAVGLAIVQGDGSEDSTGVTHGLASGTTPPERTGARPTESTPASTPRSDDSGDSATVAPDSGGVLGVKGGSARRPRRPAPPATRLIPTVSPPSSLLGVYTGGGNAVGVDRFATWLGNPLDRALEFLDDRSWETIESPTWVTSQWNGRGYRMDISVPMFPASGGSLTTGASGGYNSHFAKLGQTLVANGQANAIIRPGWEFNGSWFKWFAGSTPGVYAAYFRQIVNAMRSVPGQRFEFEWNPAIGTADVRLGKAYPGDQYVDYIGLDVYDQSWIPRWRSPAARWKSMMSQRFGLRWHRNFSARHGKPMTYPEWGLMTRSDGHGGGDNPYFISRMHEWIRTNNVANHYYFEWDAPDGNHELASGQFPRSAARFRQLFGAATS